MVEEIIRRCHASAGCSSSLGIRVSLTKGQAVDVKRVARELGVRYVLEGSVRKSGNRVRITAQLIDAATGNHIWAERYDSELIDIFDVQDQVTTRVVGAIAPKLEQV